jgi:hypothetical protein
MADPVINDHSLIHGNTITSAVTICQKISDGMDDAGGVGFAGGDLPRAVDGSGPSVREELIEKIPDVFDKGRHANGALFVVVAAPAKAWLFDRQGSIHERPPFSACPP